MSVTTRIARGLLWLASFVQKCPPNWDHDWRYYGLWRRGCVCCGGVQRFGKTLGGYCRWDWE